MVQLQTLLQKIKVNAQNKQLLKITLGNKKDALALPKNVFIKPVIIKNSLQLSFTYRNPTNDITKNFEIDAALVAIEQLVAATFLNMDVYTVDATIYYTSTIKGKEKVITKNNAIPKASIPTLQHNKQKNVTINNDAFYLKALGVCTADGKIKNDKQHKFRQINKYVEIVASILKTSNLPTHFTVADMGSGKGYLTFALYDYLQQQQYNATVIGVEMRTDLVQTCNNIAQQAGYQQLHFKEGTIQQYDMPAVDMLIALHACDTATDDAIAKGIKANAAIIICAPCCHKQIRKQMAPTNAMQYITQHGILLERQAEMVTDTIRALILEAHGYKTKVFDFIEQDDTPKNVLIVGTKSTSSTNNCIVIKEKIAALKSLFGIQQHYLETLLP
ncbi:class I SAM-dependent methyltransferase [Ferruginibacter yonginensis]|uniref:Class I SAM-dependent methyltransferase n=1 Tax=Ferruginibacter yonginensis TaxID=1310416 RepID=A0ABV8QR73_9BACT